jgi:hypothetical protein
MKLAIITIFTLSILSSRRKKIKIHKTIILHLVLYGCETLYLTLKKEHRLKVTEDRMLRRIVAPQRDVTIGGWRKLHNDEPHNLPIYQSIYLWLYSPCGPWPIFQFLNPYTIGKTPWTGISLSQGDTQNNTNTE